MIECILNNFCKRGQSSAGVERMFAACVRDGRLAVVLFSALLSLGCQTRQSSSQLGELETEGSEIATSQAFESSQVELSQPTFKIDDDGVCWFEIHYKFLKGKPVASYLLTLRFPGTKNAAIKEMAGWQFPGTEGVIKDGIQLQEPDFSEYEFIFSEAEVPMDGYTKISNVLTGTYEKP